MAASPGFNAVLGRGLLGELRHFVHRPFLVVTMEDLWPRFAEAFAGAECHVHFVASMDQAALETMLATLPAVEAVVGLGGGMAIDTAKYIAWRRRLPLFQVPTALSVDAMFGHRAGVRVDGVVQYVGWAVPEAVYVDLDILRAAPRQLNWSGIGDILCNHTGVLDWRYAHRTGRCEPRWPYDEALAQRSLEKVEAVLAHTAEIRDLTDRGIAVLIDGLRWGGGSFHAAGWMPRHIEGVEHFFFYTLEYLTGRKFIHGQPVGLGIYIGSLLHESRAAEMLHAMRDIGLDIRPQAMGLTWADVGAALAEMRGFVHRNGLWHSIAHDTAIAPGFVDRVRDAVEAAYPSPPAP
jgi:glycerol dehydrogenase-like iron-containing ADH family enzyme